MVRNTRTIEDALASAQTSIDDLTRREQRLIEAQRISGVGSYDFELATNTNL
ncbi:MAG: hypothetical protein M3P04_06720 [Actinomycetota bacterium]|nr:hypothetical protein [Actinomycetota bacterium]